MERADVIVLQIDLDEGLPVVVALVHMHPVEHMAAEVEYAQRAEARQVGRHVAATGGPLEQHAVPGLDGVVVQVQARRVGEMGCANQFAVQVVGPAVQRADDVVARVATAAQHHRLAVPADVGDQFHAALGAHERAAFAFLRQRIVVTELGHRQRVPDVARAAAEDPLAFALEQFGVEIGRYRELRGAAQQRFERNAQVRHDSLGVSTTGVRPRAGWRGKDGRDIQAQKLRGAGRGAIVPSACDRRAAWRFASRPARALAELSRLPEGWDVTRPMA